MEDSSVYQCPAVQRPTIEQLQSLAQAAHLHISTDDLQQYKGYISHVLNLYDDLDTKLVEHAPVTSKHPTTAGRVLTPSQNPYNAWARITDIVGSEAGKLTSKSVAVKDIIHVAGVPMTCGSNFMRGFVSSYSATVVSRILEAGGRIKGTSTCENMCFGGCSFTPATGPVLNPFDVTRSAGGTSSGSAVLVAIGDVDMALGSDSAGSVRLPACWCGVVGLKPTYGLVPYTGALYLDSNMDHLGPITATVHDCALMLEVLAGPDGLGSCQRQTPTIPNYTEHLTGDVSGLRIGVLIEGFDGCEADVAETVRNAVNSLKQLGVSVDEFSSTLHNDLMIAGTVMLIEGSYDTFCHSGMNSGSEGFKDTTTHDYLFRAYQSVANTLPANRKMLTLIGSYVRENYGCHFYSKSVNIVRQLTAEYDQLFQRYDVIVMPTIKFKPPKLPPAGLNIHDFLSRGFANCANTIPYNATGHPALTINAGFSDTQPRLPIGIQFVGRRHDDVTVLRLAHAYERLRDSLGCYKEVETSLAFRVHGN